MHACVRAVIGSAINGVYPPRTSAGYRQRAGNYSVGKFSKGNGEWSSIVRWELRYRYFGASGDVWAEFQCAM